MAFQLLRTSRLASSRLATTPIARTFIPTQTRLASSTTNPKNTPPSSAANQESDEINSSRATDSRSGSPDTASVQNPVSNPGQGGAAQAEEPQQSWQNVRRDPSEPDDVKRNHVESEGRKKMDPADEPVGGGRK